MLQNELNKSDISSILEEHLRLVLEIVQTDSISGAKAVIEVINILLDNNKDLKKTNPEIFNAYQQCLISLKYVILYELSDDEIVDLLKNHFDFVLDNFDYYDLDKKIKYKIREIIGPEARDVFKSKLINALLACDAKLTNKELVINNHKVDVSVAAWLKKYCSAVGMESADTLKVSEYLTKDNEIRTLSPSEQDKIKTVFHIFENLKVSSKKFPLFEESFVAIMPNGEIAIIENDKVEKISSNINSLAKDVNRVGVSGAGNSAKNKGLNNVDVLADDEIEELIVNNNVKNLNATDSQSFTEILNNYPPSSLEYKAIKQEIERLRKIKK